MASSVVELNQQNDSNLAAKSARLHSPVDENHKETIQKCSHFSIRGYVSEVRKKDPKLCYPFTLQDTTDPQLELPPMVVPNFRWWRCISCVPEAKSIRKKSSGAVNEEAQDDVIANGSILLVGQSSKNDNEALTHNTDANTSSDSNDNKNVSPISADWKGKGKAHFNDDIPPSSGCENGFVKISSCQRNPQQNLGQREVDPSTDNDVELRSKSNQNGTTTSLHRDCRAGRAEVGTSEGFVIREVDRVTKNGRGESQTSPQHQRADSLTDGVAGIVVTSQSQSQCLVSLPDLNECSGEPLSDAKNEANLTGNNMNHFCDDDDDYLWAERRKKPKVRLLSELLGLKETQNSGKGKKKTLSSASSLDEGVKRKRVGSQDEGLKSTESRGTDDGTKKSVGTSDNSESEDWSDSDDVSTEKISEALAKRSCKSKDAVLEKRNKKIKKDHGDTSSTFRHKTKPKSGPEKGNISGETTRNLDFLTRIGEKNSTITRKRKSHQAQKEPSSPIPSKSRIPKECGTTQKDGKAEQSATEKVRKASENGHYFLISGLNKENDQLCVPRKDGVHNSSSQAEQVPVAGNGVHKDNNLNSNTGETSVTTEPTVAEASCIADQTDGDRSVFPAPNPSEKKTEIPKADGGVFPLQPSPVQVANSHSTQKELTNEVRGRIQDIDINSIPADDKTNEQGPGDVFPMDIVELMAKHQYERHLDDGKDKRDCPAAPALSDTCARPNGNFGPYRQHVQSFAQSHFISMQKPPSTDPRVPLFNESLGHYTYYNSNHVGVRCLPKENPVSGRLMPPSQAQEHMRPYSARGLTPNNWNGNLNAAMPQRYPPSFLHAVDSYHKHRPMAPRPNVMDTHRGWPSGMTSRMPLGITNPQMISQSSNVMSKGRIHQPSSGGFLNFNAAAASNLDKQQNLNFSHAYNIGKPESSSRSPSDVNEAIPAMHLLSLMQTAAKLQNTELSLGPQKMAGPTSSRYPFSKNNSRTTTIQDNSCHPCYPTTLPTARAFPLACQNECGNISRTTPGFLGPIPLTLRGQRNIEASHFVPQSGDHRPLKRPMAPPHDKGKGFTSMTKPAYVNNAVIGMKDSPKLQRVAGVRRDNKIVPPAPDKVICQLNRNPSEFNDLKLVAKYMIGPDDLKPRKTARDKAPRPRGNSKRQNNVKANKPTPSVIAAKS